MKLSAIMAGQVPAIPAVKVGKAFVEENRMGNPLIINGVKPSRTKSK